MTRGKQSSEYAVTIYGLSLSFVLAVLGVGVAYVTAIAGMVAAYSGARGAVKFKQGEQ